MVAAIDILCLIHISLIAFFSEKRHLLLLFIFLYYIYILNESEYAKVLLSGVNKYNYLFSFLMDRFHGPYK